MRYTGPKNRLARRQGADLNLKTPGTKAHSNLLKRLNIIPGEHGAARQKKLTDFGTQLKEKQKLKRIYNITERQLSNYYEASIRTLGNTAEILSGQLERRLDNVIYRLGFAPTRNAARQLVTHGHVEVNKKKLSIPSYQVRVDDVVTFKLEKTAKIPYIEENMAKDLMRPAWIERKASLGKIINMPKRDDFTDEVNLQLVVEFYSR